LAQLVKPVGLYTYNPSTWEAEAEESQIWSQPGLAVRPCLKTNKQKQKPGLLNMTQTDNSDAS
jgi:hypothetical protein